MQIDITAEAPLLFWSLLPGGESRRTPIAARAVAGISAPLCTACGIEPIAVAALDSADTVNFGFGDPAAGQLYTLAYQCSGTPAPAALPGTATVVRYDIVNRFDAAGTLDESQQLYRDGAGGLIASTAANPTGSTVPLACMAINDPAEVMWASLSPNTCSPGCAGGSLELRVRPLFPLRQHRAAGYLYGERRGFHQPLRRISARHRRHHRSDGSLQRIHGKRPPCHHRGGSGYPGDRRYRHHDRPGFPPVSAGVEHRWHAAERGRNERPLRRAVHRQCQAGSAGILRRPLPVELSIGSFSGPGKVVLHQ